MNSEDEAYLREFHRALAIKPLEPDDEQYFELYKDPDLALADPVEDLATGIEWEATQSVHLFSGFRGTGKSTELRRLRARLHQQGCYKVVLCDMKDYLDLSTPVDISDFLISVAGALSEALEDTDLLGKDCVHENYWTRVVNFLGETKVDLNEFSLDLPGANLKGNLKQDPSFRQRLQERLHGHLDALVSDVHAFIQECVKELKDKYGDGTEVVLILDSIEQIRGNPLDSKVYSAVENLFYGHAEKLRLPYVHVVYTVPPWLKISVPGVAGLYDTSQLVPCIKVIEKEDGPCQAALDALAALIKQRGDWTRLLPDRSVLDRLSLASGGYLRDLFRLLRVCLRQVRRGSLPADERIVELAEDEIRNSYLPISYEDAKWLGRVSASHRAEIASSDGLRELSRLFDNHLVLCYRNGKEWYSVHPLVEPMAIEIAEAAARIGPPKPPDEQSPEPS